MSTPLHALRSAPGTADFGDPLPSNPDRVGVLLVPGIGARRRGDALLRCAEPLYRWVEAWIRADPTRRDRLALGLSRTTLGNAVTGGEPAPAHLRLTVAAHGPAPPGAPDAPLRADWLIAESWWAERFGPPSFWALAWWVFGVAPVMLDRHLGQQVVRTWGSVRCACRTIGRPIEAAPAPAAAASGAVPPGARRGPGLPALAQPRDCLAVAVSVAVMLLLPALCFAVGFAAQALMVALLALAAVPPLRGFAAGVQLRIAHSLGDTYVLVSSPLRCDAMVRQVQRDLAWLRREQGCGKVALVAHSQGAAVAFRALKDLYAPPAEPAVGVDRFVTFGSGIAKLHLLEQLPDKQGWIRTSGVLRFVAMLCLLVGLVAWHANDAPPWPFGPADAGAPGRWDVPWPTGMRGAWNVPGVDLPTDLPIGTVVALCLGAWLALEGGAWGVRRVAIGWPAWVAGAASWAAGAAGWVARRVAIDSRPARVCRSAVRPLATKAVRRLRRGRAEGRLARGRPGTRGIQALTPEYLRIGDADGASRVGWTDLYATHDPVPDGPLLADPPARLGLASAPIDNERSSIGDHTAYWRNQEQFVAALAADLARLGRWEEPAAASPRDAGGAPSVAWIKRRRLADHLSIAGVTNLLLVPLAWWVLGAERLADLGVLLARGVRGVAGLPIVPEFLADALRAAVAEPAIWGWAGTAALAWAWHRLVCYQLWRAWARVEADRMFAGQACRVGGPGAGAFLMAVAVPPLALSLAKLVALLTGDLAGPRPWLGLPVALLAVAWSLTVFASALRSSCARSLPEDDRPNAPAPAAATGGDRPLATA